MTPHRPHVEAMYARYRLSQPQRDVCDLLLTGLSNKEIAWQLYRSEKTVRNHLYAVSRKLGTHDRTQIVLLLLGAIEPTDEQEAA